MADLPLLRLASETRRKEGSIVNPFISFEKLEKKLFDQSSDANLSQGKSGNALPSRFSILKPS